MNKKLFSLLFILIISSVYAQDTDLDGVLDANDNCVYVYNPSQEDQDGDQIGDVCDCEPTFSNPLGNRKPAVLIFPSPSININYNTYQISTGTITFTLIVDSPGTTPIYQWQKNGINVGTNSPTYTESSLNSGDFIECQLTSDIVCASGNTGKHKVNIIVSSLSSNNSDKNRFQIYPNPVKDKIFIKNIKDINTAKIYDASGKLLTGYKINSDNIEVSNLQKGAYYLEIVNASKTFKTKFIKD